MDFNQKGKLGFYTPPQFSFSFPKKQVCCSYIIHTRIYIYFLSSKMFKFLKESSCYSNTRMSGIFSSNAPLQYERLETGECARTLGTLIFIGKEFQCLQSICFKHTIMQFRCKN